VKITKRQLRRIIREEKTRLLSEQISPDDPYASVGGPDPSPAGDSISIPKDLWYEIQNFVADVDDYTTDETVTARQLELIRHFLSALKTKAKNMGHSL
jgi:hypothetical protein